MPPPTRAPSARAAAVAATAGDVHLSCSITVTHIHVATLACFGELLVERQEKVEPQECDAPSPYCTSPGGFAHLDADLYASGNAIADLGSDKRMVGDDAWDDENTCTPFPL